MACARGATISRCTDIDAREFVRTSRLVSTCSNDGSGNKAWWSNAFSHSSAFTWMDF